jgi:hypothetical protein
MCPYYRLIQELAEPEGAVGMTQLPQRLGLYLPYPFSGHAKFLAYFLQSPGSAVLQSPGSAVLQTKPHLHYPALPIAQGAENLIYTRMMKLGMGEGRSAQGLSDPPSQLIGQG